MCSCQCPVSSYHALFMLYWVLVAPCTFSRQKHAQWTLLDSMATWQCQQAVTIHLNWTLNSRVACSVSSMLTQHVCHILGGVLAVADKGAPPHINCIHPEMPQNLPSCDHHNGPNLLESCGIPFDGEGSSLLLPLGCSSSLRPEGDTAVP